MSLPYRQQVRQSREGWDWSWEQPGPRLWTRRPPDQLPPISWGSPLLRKGLVQDRLHAQNLTWSDDSDSSFFTLSDHDNSSEVDPGDGLLERLERGEVPVPRELDSRGLQGSSPFIPGTLPRQWHGQLQTHLPRRSGWWTAPQIPLYASVYDRPRYAAWGTPVPVTTGQQTLARSVPSLGDQGADRGGDGTSGVSPTGGTAGEDTRRVHTSGGPASPRSRGPRCWRALSRPGLCPPGSGAGVTCQPRPPPVWEEDDLVITRGPGAPLVFRLQHTSW